MIDHILCSPWFHAAAGAIAMISIVILTLAKWGKVIFTNGGKEANPTSNDPTVRAIWDKINVIEERQVELRTDLPRELRYFVKHEDLHELKECQHRIEEKLDRFMEDCRKGNCAAGRVRT